LGVATDMVREEGWMYQAAARLQALLRGESDLASVLRGAGLVIVIRVLASAVGFVSVVLLARWMGSSEYGLYSFAIALMTLFAYPATLGLAGAAVFFMAQHSAADDWQHVAGFMKVSSWLALGCGASLAILAIGLCFSSSPILVWHISRQLSWPLPAFQSSLSALSGRKPFAVSVGWRLLGCLCNLDNPCFSLR